MKQIKRIFIVVVIWGNCYFVCYGKNDRIYGNVDDVW